MRQQMAQNFCGKKQMMRALSLLAFFGLLLSCSGPRGIFSGGSPRDQYAQSLQSAGLSQSGMGRQWAQAGAQSLAQPADVSLPYKEGGYFPPHTPRAVALRFSAPRGQQLRISIAVKPDSGAQLFAELWTAGQDRKPRLIESMEQKKAAFSYDVESDGQQFILRLQPELLAALSYTLTITGTPSLGFPVKGGGAQDIGSLWGDPRDRGARKHEGIDIFGKKRTPLVASADGTVTRVQETGLGGKVVWLRPDHRDISLYYAHLDSQLVTQGQKVKKGAVLGLMGNTGNARNTATHLHFGIYGSGGPVNPYYYVAGGTGTAPPVAGKTSPLDSLLRTENRAQLLSATDDKQGVPLPAGTAARVLSASAGLYRVELPDGRQGWLKTGTLVSLSTPLRSLRLARDKPLLARPAEGDAVIETLPSGAAVQVLAASGDWLFARGQKSGGWLRE